MDTKALEYFISVYENASVTAAAKLNYISPQGISKSITHLEAELGHPLFTRSNRGMEPTAFACQFYPTARQIVSLVASASEPPSSANEQVIELVTTSGYLFTLGENLWSGFAKKYPGTRIAAREALDVAACELVLSGAADCGCVAGPIAREGLVAQPLHRHPFVAVVGVQSPLAQRDSLSWNDLDGLPVSVMGQGFTPHQRIRDHLSLLGVEPSRYIDVLEFSTGFGYAARNEAVHITADFVARNNPNPAVMAIPFDDPSFSWDTYFVTRVNNGDALGSELQEVYGYLAERLDEAFGESAGR